MKLHCPDCGSPIPAEDINLATGMAKCRQCNSVFRFGDALGDQRRPPTAPAASPILPRSRRVQISEFAGVLTLRWRWFAFTYVFLAFFCVAWDSFLVFWYSMALGDRHAPWLMVVFPIAHVAVGVGLTYFTLAGFVNSTTVTVGQDALTVRHYPLPWWGNRTLPTNRITQLHCEQKLSTSSNTNQVSLTYDLFAVLTDGQKLRLLGGFTDPGDPRLIEQRIEQFLKIPNRAVVGEYRG